MRVYPSDFDKVDRKMAKDITPPDCFVTDMMVCVRWMDHEGNDLWRLYNATAEGTVSGKIGLLELAKFQIVNRCGADLFDVNHGDDDDE